MDALNLQTHVSLNDGTRIPQLGLGVFKLKDGPDFEPAVEAALECGYRHIDTAAVYGNEAALGGVLAASGLPRDQLYVTTKCWIKDFGRTESLDALAASLDKLRLDYVDLYLLHWPLDERMMEAWEAFQELKAEGLTRSIGVSNFTVRRFEEFFFRHTDVVPAMNQTEIHPLWNQADVRDYCAERDIAVTSYSPLAQGCVLNNPTVTAIANETGKTPAQVVLRWHLQHGLVVIPKSKTPSRIRENADLYDFALTDDHLRRIDALNANQAIIQWRPEGQENWY